MNELLELLGLVDEAKKAQAQQLVDAIKLKIARISNAAIGIKICLRNIFCIIPFHLRLLYS